MYCNSILLVLSTISIQSSILYDKKNQIMLKMWSLESTPTYKKVNGISINPVLLLTSWLEMSMNQPNGGLLWFVEFHEPQTSCSFLGENEPHISLFWFGSSEALEQQTPSSWIHQNGREASCDPPLHPLRVSWSMDFGCPKLYGLKTCSHRKVPSYSWLGGNSSHGSCRRT